MEAGRGSVLTRIYVHRYNYKKRFSTYIHIFYAFNSTYLLFGLQLYISSFNLQLRKQEDSDERNGREKKTAYRLKNQFSWIWYSFRHCVSVSSSSSSPLSLPYLSTKYIYDYWKSIFCCARHVLQYIVIVNSSCVCSFFFRFSFSSFNRKSVLLKHLITFWCRNLSYCLHTRHTRIRTKLNVFIFVFFHCKNMR